MSTGLAEVGGFETQTPGEKTPDGDIVYSLLERRLSEGITNGEPEVLAMLAEVIASPDPTLQSIAICSCAELIREGVRFGWFSNDQLDAARNMWRGLMESEDESVRYEAQEVFVLEEEQLKKHDVTTHIWLRDAVTVEWFN
jgi:hypothetical protein